MPRNGSGVYEMPNGTHGVEATTIESVKYNTYVDDVEFDLNYARPIIAGGTGAVNAVDAMTNLNGEIARQVVTNFDADILYPGSFYCAASATASPVSGHAFAGWIYVTDANNMVIQARDASDTTVPGRLYVREKKGGTWGAWKNDGRDIIGDAEGIASEAGDMFFGIKGVAPNSRFIVNDKKDATGTDLINIPKAGGLTVNGELQVGQGSATTGIIRFSSDTSRYLYFNGTVYALNGGGLNVSGAVATPSITAGTQYLNASNYSITDGSNHLLRSGASVYFQNNAGGTWGYVNGSGLTMSVGNITTPGEVNASSVIRAGGPWIMIGGGTSILYMNGPTANRYLQWDGSNYIFAGAHVYSAAGRLWGTNDFAGTPVVNGRLAYAADYSHNTSLQEPYAGAACTGGAVGYSAWSARYRWVQMYTTGWFTVGTA